MTDADEPGFIYSPPEKAEQYLMVHKEHVGKLIAAAIAEARSQAIDDCIKAIRETDARIVGDYIDALEALKGSIEKETS